MHLHEDFSRVNRLRGGRLCANHERLEFTSLLDPPPRLMGAVRRSQIGPMLEDVELWRTDRIN
jgi:hypothetical protein